MEAFGETMQALDRVVDCQWGCDGDHPEKHLVGSSVSGIRAILLLHTSGYPAESGAIVRSLGESVNLMRLLITFPSELEAFGLGGRKKRKKRFSASKVRGRLKREGLAPPLGGQDYGTISDLYLHPNALGHIFGHRTSHEESVLPYFYRDMCISMFMALVSSASIALFFWACVQEDDREVRFDFALSDRIDNASFAFMMKLAQDSSANLGLDVEGTVEWLTDKGRAGRGFRAPDPIRRASYPYLILWSWLCARRRNLWASPSVSYHQLTEFAEPSKASCITKTVMPFVEHGLTNFPATIRTRFCLRRKYVHPKGLELSHYRGAKDHGASTTSRTRYHLPSQPEPT